MVVAGSLLLAVVTPSLLGLEAGVGVQPTSHSSTSGIKRRRLSKRVLRFIVIVLFYAGDAKLLKPQPDMQPTLVPWPFSHAWEKGQE